MEAVRAEFEKLRTQELKPLVVLRHGDKKAIWYHSLCWITFRIAKMGK